METINAMNRTRAPTSSYQVANDSYPVASAPFLALCQLPSRETDSSLCLQPVRESAQFNNKQHRHVLQVKGTHAFGMNLNLLLLTHKTPPFAAGIKKRLPEAILARKVHDPLTCTN